MPDRYPDQAAMHYLSRLEATISRRTVMNSKRLESATGRNEVSRRLARRPSRSQTGE